MKNKETIKLSEQIKAWEIIKKYKKDINTDHLQYVVDIRKDYFFKGIGSYCKFTIKLHGGRNDIIFTVDEADEDEVLNFFSQLYCESLWK